ncbi:MAG: hypothetical protein FWC54_01130 [Actinomycetia bacterium]|nr:hypothetical protein [Actinomycetes bacterium]
MKSRLLLIAYTISGLAALVYELGWMRELSAMLGATAYASGTMLAAYMFGLGLGALVGTWRGRRSLAPLIDASFAELGVALFSIAAFAGIRFLPGLYFNWMRSAGRGTAGGFLTLQFFVCFLIMVLPTFAMGMTYPLIMSSVGNQKHLGAAAGRLYAVNTGGAIAGSLLATFAFLPTIGVKGSLIVAAALSILAAVLLRAIASGQKPDLLALFRRPVTVALAVVTIVGVSIIPSRSGSPLGLGQAFYYKSAASFKELSGQRSTLYDREGIYSRVQVTENPDGTKTLSNGALDEGTNNLYDRVTTTLLSAVPAMSTEASRSAFVLGLGTGYTSQTYAELGFARIMTVEINPDVGGAAEFFTGSKADVGDTSGGWGQNTSLLSTRTTGPTLPQIGESGPWQVVIDDARAHLLTSPARYDCITSEPSWPWSSGVAALFTEEFMSAAKSRLEPGGVYCQWLPNYLLESRDVAMMYKTMRKVYPRVDIWSINFPDSPDGELLLIGHTSATGGLSQAQIKARLDALLKSHNFNNPYLTADSITPSAQTATIRELAARKSTPINTDDHSTLEYRVFWNYLARAFSRTSVLEQ